MRRAATEVRLFWPIMRHGCHTAPRTLMKREQHLPLRPQVEISDNSAFGRRRIMILHMSSRTARPVWRRGRILASQCGCRPVVMRLEETRVIPSCHVLKIATSMFLRGSPRRDEARRNASDGPDTIYWECRGVQMYYSRMLVVCAMSHSSSRARPEQPDQAVTSVRQYALALPQRTSHSSRKLMSMSHGAPRIDEKGTVGI